MSTVCQEWVTELPWKFQSILFTSLRGPDQELLVNIKQFSKWMRSVTQKNADPSKPCTKDIKLPKVEALFNELEHCSCHFVHHFLDGMAIIAYAHPAPKVATLAAEVHYACVEEIFHFVPEFPGIFWFRHRDKVDGQDPGASKWDAYVANVKKRFMTEALYRFHDDETEPKPRGA